MRFSEIITEGGGYIPKNSSEAKDPRWEMAITSDIQPGQDKVEANKLSLKVGTKGPAIARTNGKL